MRCQELQTSWNKVEGRWDKIPAVPVLWSLLLHGLLISMLLIVSASGSRYVSTGGALSVHLLSAKGEASQDSMTPRINLRDSTGEYQANQSAVPDTSVSKTWGASDLTAGNGEGYLPQEFLSRAASPVDDIDLQDIYSPDEGAFKMYLWIDSYGRVTRIDVEDSEVAGWLVDQVVERFKKSRFTPGLRDDRPVAAIMHVEVVF